MPTRFDRTIGYSPLASVDAGKMRQVVEATKRISDAFYVPKMGDLILVAGAGNGLEAAIVQQAYRQQTVGVDLNLEDKARAFTGSALLLLRQDLDALGFSGNTFAFIYCYHVLEHVAEPVRVLQELRRVLRPGGVLFIGFPNKHRLFAYVGTAQRASMLDKLKWNLHDYRCRLAGRFENRYGAHAGFSHREFMALASSIFHKVTPVRGQYMLQKYEGKRALIRLLLATRLDEIAFPSNYYICEKGEMEL